MIKITRLNDFTLTLSAYCMEGEEKVWVDLSLIDNLTVEIPGAPADAYTWQVDGEGRLVLDIDGPKLDVRGYGISVRGTINGRDWHWAVRRLFEVVRYTIESNVTDKETIEALCEPAGITATLLTATYMTEEEYQALEHKEEGKIYITNYGD